MVWLSFLYGTAAYWLFLAKSIFPGQVTAVPSSIPAQAIRETVRAWQIPGSWVFPLGIALRVLGVVYLLVLTYMLVVHIRKHIQLKWVLGFTSQPPDEVVAAFQPHCAELWRQPFKTPGVGRGYVAGNLRMDSSNHPPPRYLPGTGPFRPRRYFAPRVASRSPFRLCLERVGYYLSSTPFLSSSRLVCGASHAIRPGACLRSCRRLRLATAQSQVRRVSDSLCAFEFLTKHHQLGNRFRCIVGTLEGTRSLHPGGNQKVIGSVGVVPPCVWSGSACWFPRYRTISRRPAYLRTAADSPTVGSTDEHHSCKSRYRHKNSQEGPVVEGAQPRKP